MELGLWPFPWLSLRSAQSEIVAGRPGFPSHGKVGHARGGTHPGYGAQGTRRRSRVSPRAFALTPPQSQDADGVGSCDVGSNPTLSATSNSLVYNECVRRLLLLCTSCCTTCGVRRLHPTHSAARGFRQRVSRGLQAKDARVILRGAT